jgi:hypothetical protein
MPSSRALAFVIEEVKEVIPPTVFFSIGFNLIQLTTQLILADYGQQFASFMIATAAALVVGKAVLVANVLPFLRRFDPLQDRRVLCCRLPGAVPGKGCGVCHRWRNGGWQYVKEHFTWHRFAAVQIWIFVLFLVYTTASELNTLFGEGELTKIFLTRRSSELKITRRQRIRTLVKLSRLTEAHSVDELRDRNTAAHAELIALLRGLTMRKATPTKA